ncbi:MAG: hypothetical protein ACTSRS_16915 [Candidatus Helarchaeota archaeon]
MTMTKFPPKDGLDLNMIHKAILKIARMLRKKYHVFEMPFLFEKCCKELPYPEIEIEAAIRQLYAKRVIIPKQRLFKDEVLKNEKRNQIYQYVLKYPGAHERELRRAIGLGSYEVRIHLAYLQRFEFIRKNKYKNRNVFFPVDFDETKDVETLLLRNDVTNQIYNLIKTRGKVRLSEIASELDIYYTTVQVHLKDLIESHLIERLQEEGTTFYQVPSSPLPIEEEVQSKLIEVKREYDYIGGKIRFKIAVRNFSNMTINNINVSLSAPDQFILNTPLQTIANLPPNSTRGLDFDLTPVTCGQSNIFGSVSFQDAFGKVYTLPIHPKDISIKCPLVTPVTASKLEISEWVQRLKRGTGNITYHNISDSEAFRIGREQIGALDLTEVETNTTELWSLYTGVVKVTGQNTLIKLSIADSNIQVDVWAEDQKQTTGFIAYITNLINIALEMTYKMARSTEDITKKIATLLQVSQKFDEIITSCQSITTFQEISVLLTQSQKLLQESTSASSLINVLGNWVQKLQKVSDINSPLDSNLAMRLQYECIDWLIKIEEIISSNLKMYQDAFKDLNQISGDLQGGVELIKQRIEEHQRSYGLSILSYLLILDKNSGLTLYEKNLGKLDINPDLIGGFLHALQSFGTELASSEQSMKTLSYEKYQFQIESGNYVRAALILQGTPNQFLKEKLKRFVELFESQFKNYILHFSGNMSVFQSTSQIIEELFK